MISMMALAGAKGTSNVELPITQTSQCTVYVL